MPDELINSFLEQMIVCLDGISEALRILLQYYHVAIAEREFKSNNMDNEFQIRSEPGNECINNPPHINPDIGSDID